MKHSPTYTDRSFKLTLVLLCAVSLLSLNALILDRQRGFSKVKSEAIRFEPSTARLTPKQAREVYGQIPLSFEANQGQTENSVNFLARGAGYTLFLKPTEAVLRLRSADFGMRNPNPQSAIGDQQSKNSQSKVLRMKLVGANPDAAVAGADELAGKVNYFTGNDSSEWRTDVPTYARVRYSEVYPGIDLVYYGNQKQLEYDFVVAPGRDPRAVCLQFDGADKVEVDTGGDLLLTLGESIVRQPKPLVYQEVGSSRRTIEGGYAVGPDGQVGFTVGEYDALLPLVIDPVLVYSTYLGGSGTDSGNDIVVDSSGNAYICGDTTSTNFPTANAIDGTFAGGGFAGARDAFVTKLNATGSALVYSTYLGGSGHTTLDPNGDDRCFGLKVDGAGNAYVVGETHSDDFPTVNAFQGTYGGGFADAFVTKLNPAGSALVYSTFIGGNVFDAATGIELDSSQNVYITGRTTSPNFPTVNPIQGTFAGGSSDAFVMKLNAAGTALVYSTYLGGTDFENGSGIAVDSAGNAYLAGQTRSTNFPTANAIQATFGGGTPDGDAFVAKINAAGSALVYSTYLGGSDNDAGFDIAVDSAGSAHVTGSSSSTNFPTANAFDSTLGGTSDGFVMKLNAAGSALVYSTYLGGSDADSGNDIALDSSGNAYVAGGTISTNFPTANPIQATYGGGSVDAFVTKLNAAGSALIYSTYLGGGALDRGNAIAVDSCGSAYVSGTTGSTNFTTLNPIQAANGGGDDAFVTKISETTTTLQFSQPTYLVQEDYAQATLTVTRTGDTTGAAAVEYQTSDTGALPSCGTSNGLASQRCDYSTASGTVSFAAGETSKTFTVLINEDSYSEGPENFSVSLSNPTCGALTTATVTIMDDGSEAAANPIDSNDPFVQQHYHDFLSRRPDASGLAFWIGMITDESSRIDVSKAFFDSEEFGDTGFFVYRLYRASFGNLPAPNQTRANVTYADFLNDRARVIGGANIEQQRQALADAFVLRARFLAEYPVTTSTQYVNHLFDQASLTPFSSERQAEIDAMNNSGRTRAQVLRNVVEIQALKDREKNPAFVLMQYFGYLRRDPDQPGYDFWLSNINGVNRAKGMVCAFLTSREYQERFGAQVTRTNAQCNSILTLPSLE